MTLPDFSFEKKLWEKGLKLVCGVDEVGRGSFAGPVFAGAVVFSPNSKFDLPKQIIINDSKKLSEVQRKISSDWIKHNAFCWGIGSSSVRKINKHGIKKATEIAFRNAIKACNELVDFLLVDAFYVPRAVGLAKKSQTPIVKGDSLSFSIAAASILAKVERDSFMEKLGKKRIYQKYEWFKNKGYGTKAHREAITKHGITKYHRELFIRNLI